MTRTFRTTRRIEFVDTDLAGIVHFSNFFRFMEAAEIDFLRSLGLSAQTNWEGTRYGFPRVAASCDYLKPVRFEDVLDIDVRVERVGVKSVTYGFEFSLHGEPIARGRVTAVCCRVFSDQSFTSTEIPAGLRELLEQGCTGR